MVGFDLELAAFGEMKLGEVLSFQNGFTNISSDSLQIEVVSACDCMNVSWTQTPIAPGQRGVIEILFDTTNQLGEVSKDIDVIFTNTDDKGYPIIKRFVLKGRVKE